MNDSWLRDVAANLCPLGWNLDGYEHGCTLDAGHDGDHRCRCGITRTPEETP
jgi:hypothetical protein